MDKPNLSPFVLAHRLKTILTLFSPNNTESYWLDKVEQILAEAIKLCRLSHNNYITFLNIHKFITDKEYYYAQLNHLRNLFHQNHFSNSEIYDLLSGIEFFEKEFYELDDRTQSILKSEVSRITNYFVSNYTLSELFCPKASQISFHGFKEVLEKGKIVVFSMNVAEYKNVAKILATYLKLDFQSEILQQLKLKEKTTIRSSCFICDEYQEYITSTDSDFFSQSREAKCINIISTQSYSSLLNSLNNKHSVNVIIQSLVNKLWFRSDDIYTIESAQKQIGKEEKRKTSTTISENAKETNYSYLTKKFHSQDSNISESINIYYQDDFIFHTNFFTQQLETFSCVAFLSDGNKILPPTKLKMFPYFIH